MFKQFAVAISPFALAAKAHAWGSDMFYSSALGSGDLGKDFMGGRFGGGGHAASSVPDFSHLKGYESTGISDRARSPAVPEGPRNAAYPRRSAYQD